MEGNYEFKDVRASAVLTTGYVAGTVLDYSNVNPSQYNQLVILWSFTIGSLTSGELKVEFSHDGTTYYQETFSSVSSGTSTESLGEHTQTGTGNYRLAIPLKDNYVKISVKGTGTVTSSLCAVSAALGNT